MSTGEIAVYVIALIIYTIAAVCIVRSCKTMTGGIIGAGLLIAGGIGVYFIVPLIVALLMGILQIAVAIAIIAGIIGFLSGS